ncbi:MAG TPA: diaminopimelate epimerase, partial [Bdellovibrionota bacterium]|nr:diaminopimelate epimerase [Bdellovibrionota bacterium]
MGIPFTKMHGLGNDFVVLDALRGPVPDLGADGVPPEFARRLCDRRRGVGADQVIWLGPVAGFDAEVTFLNADGSTAETCGNGLRAVGLYLLNHGPRPGQSRYRVRDGAGPAELEILSKGPKEARIRVTMTPPNDGGERGLEAAGKKITYRSISVGNPHAVVRVESLAPYPAGEVGAAMEVHRDFANRTNVEFVQPLGPDRIRVVVWERGAGLTLACGSGACAAAVASTLAGWTSAKTVHVELPGGEAVVTWDGADELLLEGPAVEVFR